VSILENVESYASTPEPDPESKLAWELYCADSAGWLHQLDYPDQMTPDMWVHYRTRARQRLELAAQ